MVGLTDDERFLIYSLHGEKHIFEQMSTF